MSNALQIYLQQERGRAVRLASALGISPGAVSQWDRVPAERVAEIEQVTGIPRRQLRPDLFAADAKSLNHRKAKPGSGTIGTEENDKIVRKSIIGCMKGMVTFPPDFNPSEPFWSEHEDWDNYSVGGLDDK
jgi:DNA-binding transcriptional regulator YdaS (Cro superfamily)